MAGFNLPHRGRSPHPLVDAARKSGVSLRRERGQFWACRFGCSVELLEDHEQNWWMLTDTPPSLGPYQDPQDLLQAALEVLTEQADRSRHRLVQGRGIS